MSNLENNKEENSVLDTLVRVLPFAFTMFGVIAREPIIVILGVSLDLKFILTENKNSIIKEIKALKGDK